MDEGLSWDEQLSKVRGNISDGLKKLKNLIPQSELDQLYCALVESHLRYADDISGSLPKSRLNPLQRLQVTARSITDKARLKEDWFHNCLTATDIV